MSQVEIKSPDEIALMREAGRIVCEILDELEKAVAPGVTTWELDALAEKLIYQKGAKPAFKGYLGFPCCLCASVNEEVVHGIPSKRRKLAEGDLMKLDFGVVYRGFFGDSARTVPVGKVSSEAQALVNATREALQKGIAAMVPGNRIGRHWPRGAELRGGAGVLRGAGLHGARHWPQAPREARSAELRSGRRGHEAPCREWSWRSSPWSTWGPHEVELLDDDWTAVTLDHKLSAHFEHTILDHGPWPRGAHPEGLRGPDAG